MPEVWEVLRNPVALGLAQVERDLRAALGTRVEPLGLALQRVLPGGKRLRPLLVLLAASLGPAPERARPVAVAIELLHMATLVHDDVVDGALVRRSQRSVQAEWGPGRAMQAGNFLFGKALLALHPLRSPYLERQLALTLQIMCEGELMQWSQRFLALPSLGAYLRRIRRKTALLLSLSCQLGAHSAGASVQVERALRSYGCALGMAFQLVDDALDWQGSEEQLGKPMLQDLQQGYITLPVWYALQPTYAGSAGTEALLDQYLRTRGVVPGVLVQAVQESGGVAATLALARRYAKKAEVALHSLPTTPAHAALARLTAQVVQRTT